MPLARAHQVPLDGLVDAPAVGDPRVRLKPRSLGRLTVVPLSSRVGCRRSGWSCPVADREPDPRTLEGYRWIYVLSGRLRLVPADHDVLLTSGEAAEFDTRVLHRFGAEGPGPVS